MAWEATATQLLLTASNITAEISALESVWSGPSSCAMTKKISNHVKLLHETANKASLTANQARCAAEAFNVAFMAMVPPSVVAENRLLLTQLVATNFLGQNTPAIMATEAHYAEMWAQDASAMFSYQASSAQATQALPNFTNVFAPGTNQATGGLAGLLNLISGSSKSSFGSLLNSTVINSILLSSGFLCESPLGLIEALTGVSAVDDATQITDGTRPYSYIPPIDSGQPVVTSNAENVNLQPSNYYGTPRAGTARGSIGTAKSVGDLKVPPSWVADEEVPFITPIPLALGGRAGGLTEKRKNGIPVKFALPQVGS